MSPFYLLHRFAAHLLLLQSFKIPKWKANPDKYLNRSFYVRLIIKAFPVPTWPYGYWFLTGCRWPQFIFLIFLCAHMHKNPGDKQRERCLYSTDAFLSSSMSPHISSGDKGRETVRRLGETNGVNERRNKVTLQENGDGWGRDGKQERERRAR